MMAENGPKESRRETKLPYVRPVLRKVPLRPEEAVLGFCKSSNTSGPSGPTNCFPIGPCSTQGT